MWICVLCYVRDYAEYRSFLFIYTHVHIFVLINMYSCVLGVCAAAQSSARHLLQRGRMEQVRYRLAGIVIMIVVK